MVACVHLYIYLLLDEFEVRTVNYRTTFFAWAINQWEKNRIHNLQYGPRKRG